MATIIFWEPGTDATGNLSNFDGSSGTVTSDTGQAESGPRSVKCFTSSPAVSAIVLKSGVLADVGRRMTWGFRFDTTPAAQATIASLQTSGGAATVCSLALNTDDTISVIPVGATTVKGTTVLSTNTWYRLTLSYTITNTTTFRFQLYINGTAEVNATAGTLTNTGTNRMRWQLNAGAGANVSAWVDSLYLDDGSDYTDPGNWGMPRAATLSSGAGGGRRFAMGVNV